MNLILWENGRLEIWYLSEDGETFAALRMYEFNQPTARKMRALGAENAGELAEFLADHIDFSAVCENNGRSALSCGKSACVVRLGRGGAAGSVL